MTKPDINNLNKNIQFVNFTTDNRIKIITNAIYDV